MLSKLCWFLLYNNRISYNYTFSPLPVEPSSSPPSHPFGSSQSARLGSLCYIVTYFLRRNFIAIQSYCKKLEKSQINNLTLHLKQLEKEQTKPKVSRRKEIIKIRVEINDIKKAIALINETKSCLFEKIQYKNL